MQTDDQQSESALALSKLLQHHISEDHLPTGYSVARKEAVLLTLGLGGLNYVPVAYQNGNTYTMSVINAVTTAILGEILLYLSGKIYYDIKIEPQYIDEKLKDIIQAPLTEKAFIQETSAQLLLAAASAVPLATTLFDANLPIFDEYPWLFWLTISYIEIVNTAMHLVPIELTMRDAFYSFLPHQLLRFCLWLTSFLPEAVRNSFSAGMSFLSNQLLRAYSGVTGHQLLENEVKSDQASLDARATILTKINPMLNSAKENFIRDLASQNTQEIQSKLARYKNTPNDLLTEMLACYVTTPSLNPYARAMARVSGGLLVSGACLGYAANPYLVFENDFHLSMELSIGTTAMPIYFFMVLMTFFGDGTGARALRDVLSLFQPSTAQKRLPTAATLYPVTFTIVAAVILFMAVFTGAPGREMMKIAYSSTFSELLMSFMIWVVNIGIGLLTLYAALDFSKIMFNNFAQHEPLVALLIYGAQHAPLECLKIALNYCIQSLHSESKQSVAVLKAKIEALIRDFNRINPIFAKELNTQVMQLAPPAELEKLESFNKKNSSGNQWYCFLKSENNDEACAGKKPLLSADESDDVGLIESVPSTSWYCC